MTVRPIVISGNPVLHRPAARVTTLDDALRELVADMHETMDASHGVGLAAPQIGVGLRIFTYIIDNEDGVPPRGTLRACPRSARQPAPARCGSGGAPGAHRSPRGR